MIESISNSVSLERRTDLSMRTEVRTTPGGAGMWFTDVVAAAAVEVGAAEEYCGGGATPAAMALRIA